MRGLRFPSEVSEHALAALRRSARGGNPPGSRGPLAFWHHGFAAYRAAATEAGTIARRSHDHGCFAASSARENSEANSCATTFRAYSAGLDRSIRPLAREGIRRLLIQDVAA